MSKLRILRVQSRICVGGPALNTILLSAHLNPEKYQTLLVGGELEPGEKTMEPMALDQGVAVHIIREMGRSIRWSDDLRALWKLYRLIRYFKPHILHTHTAKAGAMGRLAGFFARVPVRIHTFHGHVFHGYFGSLTSRLFIWFERLLALMSHGIVAISPRQKEDLTVTYGVVSAAKCRIVRLGFQLDQITDGRPGVFKRRLGLPSDIRLAGILARLVPIKNHQLLLRAIADWAGRSGSLAPDRLRFLIIGDGELRGELERLVADLGIGDYVLFTGWQGRVAEIYADLDLNLLVSKNEGTPVSLIEGLACGVPILTTDVGGIRDFADESYGTIVPAQISPHTLADHLEQIFGDPLYLEPLSSEIRRQIHETFDVKRLVSDMEAFYEALGA